MKWLSHHIGGQKWGTYLVPPRSKYLRREDGGYDVARCDYEHCRISISREGSREVIEERLLHEAMHALAYVSGAEKAYDGDADKDEFFVGTITPHLHRLLKDLGFVFPST